MKNWMKKLCLFAISIIFMGAGVFINSASSADVVLSPDELFNNFDSYIGKKVTVSFHGCLGSDSGSNAFTHAFAFTGGGGIKAIRFTYGYRHLDIIKSGLMDSSMKCNKSNYTIKGIPYYQRGKSVRIISISDN